MPNIFGGTAGRIIAVDSGDDNFLPIGLVVGDLKNDLGAKCLLSGMTITGESGVQVMHTLRQYIYFYTFGERVGEVTISGLCFHLDCSGLDVGVGNVGPGLARLMDWYERRRVSTTGQPILLTLCAGVVLQGILVKFRYQTEDPSIGLSQFTLQFIYPPRIKAANAPPAFPPASLGGGFVAPSTNDVPPISPNSIIAVNI